MVAQAFNPSTAEAEAAILCEFKAYVMSSQSARAMERDLVSNEEKEKKLFGFCQSIAQVADVSTCTCVGEGEKGSLVLQ